jgi:hypothetical protein
MIKYRTRTLKDEPEAVTTVTMSDDDLISPKSSSSVGASVGDKFDDDEDQECLIRHPRKKLRFGFNFCP